MLSKLYNNVDEAEEDANILSQENGCWVYIDKEDNCCYTIRMYGGKTQNTVSAYFVGERVE